MAVRPQLHHETVPERYEREAKPGAENDLQRSLADRTLAALKPVRSPVRGLDLASRAQTPDDFPSLGAALPLTLQMAFFRSERPLRMNHNIRHQRRRQQLHRRLSLLPLQLMNLVPLKDSIPPISPDT